MSQAPAQPNSPRERSRSPDERRKGTSTPPLDAEISRLRLEVKKLKKENEELKEKNTWLMKLVGENTWLKELVSRFRHLICCWEAFRLHMSPKPVGVSDIEFKHLQSEITAAEVAVERQTKKIAWV